MKVGKQFLFTAEARTRVEIRRKEQDHEGTLSPERSIQENIEGVTAWSAADGNIAKEALKKNEKDRTTQ